jgi:hypothetical protein
MNNIILIKGSINYQMIYINHNKISNNNNNLFNNNNRINSNNQIIINNHNSSSTNPKYTHKYKISSQLKVHKYQTILITKKCKIKLIKKNS